MEKTPSNKFNIKENIPNKVNIEENAQNNNSHKKIFVIVALVFAFILIIILFIYFNQGGIGGKAILSLETNYAANESLRGTLSLSLKQGELIPADSIVRINMGGED